MDPQVKQDNQKKVELTFRVMDAMENLRDVWRAAAPIMELDEQEKEKAVKQISKARAALDELEKMI